MGLTVTGFELLLILVSTLNVLACLGEQELRVCKGEDVEMDFEGKVWTKYCCVNEETEEDAVFLREYGLQGWKYLAGPHLQYQGRYLLSLYPCNELEFDSMGNSWTVWCYNNKTIQFEKMGGRIWVYKQDYKGGYTHLQYRRIILNSEFLKSFLTDFENEQSKVISNTQLMQLENDKREDKVDESKNEHKRHRGRKHEKHKKYDEDEKADQEIQEITEIIDSIADEIDNGNERSEDLHDLNNSTEAVPNENILKTSKQEKESNTSTTSIIDSDSKPLLTSAIPDNFESAQNSNNSEIFINNLNKNLQNSSNLNTNKNKHHKNPRKQDLVNITQKVKIDLIESETTLETSISQISFSSPDSIQIISLNTSITTEANNIQISDTNLSSSNAKNDLVEIIPITKSCVKLEGDRSGRYFNHIYLKSGKKVEFKQDEFKNFIIDPRNLLRVPVVYEYLPEFVQELNLDRCEVLDDEGNLVYFETDLFVPGMLWQVDYDDGVRVKYLRAFLESDKKKGMYLIDDDTGLRLRSFI